MPFDHVRGTQLVSEVAIVPTDANSRGDPDLARVEFLQGEGLAFAHQPTTEPAMLPTVLCGFVNLHHGTEHLQLPYGGSGFVDPEARVGDEDVEPGILDAEEDLVSSGGLVIASEDRERFRAWLDAAESDFPAPHADTPQAEVSKAFPREQPEISLLRTILDFRRPDLALHALDAAPPRHHRLHAGDEVDGLFRRERRVPPGFPESVQGRFGQDQRRIDLQKVRTVVRIFEQRPEGVEVAVAIRTGEARHHVRADLEAGGLRAAHRGTALRVRMAPVDGLEDIVVGRLDPQLHSGRAETETGVDLRPEKTVGLRFDREADAPHAGGLVLRLGRPDRVRDIPVHRVETPFHEPLLVSALERRERPSEHDQIDLVGRMSDVPQRPETGDDLLPGIVVVKRGASRRRFRAEVRLRSPEPRSPWTEGAYPVWARVRRGHDRHDGDAARGASRLDPQEIHQFVAARRREPTEDIRVAGDSDDAMGPRRASLQLLELILRRGHPISQFGEERREERILRRRAQCNGQCGGLPRHTDIAWRSERISRSPPSEPRERGRSAAVDRRDPWTGQSRPPATRGTARRRGTQGTASLEGIGGPPARREENS